MSEQDADRTDLDRKLDEAADGGVVEVRRSGGTARVDVAEADRLGVRVRKVSVTRDRPADVSTEAERLAGTLRALPERLTPIEVSPTLGGAVLRSRPEDMRRREFFEVQLTPDTTTVGRHRATDDGRAEVDFTLTRDQLDGLLDEL